MRQDEINKQFREAKKRYYLKKLSDSSNDNKSFLGKVTDFLIPFKASLRDRGRVTEINLFCKDIEKKAKRLIRVRQQETNSRLDTLNNASESALLKVRGRFAECLNKLNQQKLLKDYEVPNDIRIPLKELKIIKDLDVGVPQIIGRTAYSAGTLGLRAARLTEASVPRLVKNGVAYFSKAATGTPIRLLKGNAKELATMARIGGGAKSVGGGGVAAGKTFLNIGTKVAKYGSVIYTVLSVIDIPLSLHYGSKLTKAKKLIAQTDIYLEHIDFVCVNLGAICRRADELISNTEKLTEKTTPLLVKLENTLPVFDIHNQEHAKLFQSCVLLTKAVCDLVSVNLIDVDGKVTPESSQIIINTRKLLAAENK